MAQLTPQDYGQLRDAIYRAGVGKEELKSLATLPSKAQIMAAFQSLENDLVAGFPGMKTRMDAALGVATTNSLAQKIVAAFFEWRIAKMRSG